MTDASDPLRLSAWFGQDVDDMVLRAIPAGMSDAPPYVANTPGPFHVTTDNLISLAGFEADGGLLVSYDDNQEFFWRQPRDVDELAHALRLLDADEVASYACDGCLRWTATSVAHWWAGRSTLSKAVATSLETLPHSPSGWRDGSGRDHDVLRRHLAYLDGAMEQDLRRFVYFLEHGHPPAACVPLPLL